MNMLTTPATPATALAAIEVRDLGFTYRRSARPAVEGMAFRVEPGEVFGFLGPSGAGKSTTQKILIRLLRGHTGEASVLGRPVSAWGDEYFERIGVCFELPNHYQKLTALENLRFFASLYSGATEDPRHLLEAVGLAEHGSERVGGFSKGMLTRLSLARALLNTPDLLFLDEPTTGLDPVNARAMKAIVRQRQAQGCTVFLTTHDMALADGLCDRVAFVVDGRIALIDEPKRLKVERSRRRVRVEHRLGSQPRAEEFDIDGLAENREFLALLRSGQIETIHSQEATLEDVFVEVTGRSLQ